MYFDAKLTLKPIHNNIWAQIAKIIPSSDDLEAKRSLTATAIRELSPQIKGLVKWRKLSFVIERLLQSAGFEALKIFLKDSAKDQELLLELISGEHSYFVRGA